MSLSKPDVRKILHHQIYGLLSYAHGCGRSVSELAVEMIKGGVRLLQYREKERPLDVCYEECCALRALTREHGVFFIVNDHADIARYCQADGLHIGQEDLSVREARSILLPHQIVGISTHSPEQAEQAVADQVDYIGVGPIFSTETKKDVCDPVGLSYLRYVVKYIDLPFVAIGGIKASSMMDVVRAGAACVAMVTEITEAPDIPKHLRTLWDRFDNALMDTELKNILRPPS